MHPHTKQKDTHTYQRVTSRETCMRWLRHSLIRSNSCRVWSSVWGFGCWDETLPLVCPTKSPEPLKNSLTQADACFTSKKNSNTQRKSTQDHTCLCMKLYWCLFVSMPWKNHYACQYETCVPLWYDVTEQGPCDRRLLVNHSGWLGYLGVWALTSFSWGLIHLTLNDSLGPRSDHMLK